MITLKKLTWDMYPEYIALNVAKGQETYVATPLESLAEAYMNVSSGIYEAAAMGIFEDGALIGHTLIYRGRDEKGVFYDLHRFMVDSRYQGGGTGRRVFAAVMDYILSFPMGDAERVVLDYLHVNFKAEKLYKAYGFADTGEFNRLGEERAELWLNKQQI